MTVRFAQVQDVPSVVDLLIRFASEARVGFRSAQGEDLVRLHRLVLSWITDHYVRVAVADHKICGVIIAERGQDFWDPSRTILQERAWYVEPEFRNSRISARLWQAWQQDSDRYISASTVNMVLMSTQGPSTLFDPGRRGWRLIEQTWSKQ